MLSFSKSVLKCQNMLRTVVKRLNSQSMNFSKQTRKIDPCVEISKKTKCCKVPFYCPKPKLKSSPEPLKGPCDPYPAKTYDELYDDPPQPQEPPNPPKKPEKERLFLVPSNEYKCCKLPFVCNRPQPKKKPEYPGGPCDPYPAKTFDELYDDPPQPQEPPKPPKKPEKERPFLVPSNEYKCCKLPFVCNRPQPKKKPESPGGPCDPYPAKTFDELYDDPPEPQEPPKKKPEKERPFLVPSNEYKCCKLPFVCNRPQPKKKPESPGGPCDPYPAKTFDELYDDPPEPQEPPKKKPEKERPFLVPSNEYKCCKLPFVCNRPKKKPEVPDAPGDPCEQPKSYDEEHAEELKHKKRLYFKKTWKECPPRALVDASECECNDSNENI